jgi:5-methylcytosine-specific restriction endonuclease McrA
MRSVDEWIGRDDDTAIPDRVRVRIFDAKGGLCHRCRRKIRAGERWVLEHVIALINWRKTEEQPHGNRESNLDLTCSWCVPEKNAEDQAEKSEVYEIRKKHLLPKETHPGFRKWGRR